MNEACYATILWILLRPRCQPDADLYVFWMCRMLQHSPALLIENVS